MKKITLIALMAPALVFAGDLKPARLMSAVKVNSVVIESAGVQGHPATKIKAQATFGNQCAVPFPNELVKITDYWDNYGTLAITLANDSKRACPLNYAPFTVTIDLGLHIRPNDGRFSKILVNGVEGTEE